jgi:hypothetical protein
MVFKSVFKNSLKKKLVLSRELVIMLAIYQKDGLKASPFQGDFLFYFNILSTILCDKI